MKNIILSMVFAAISAVLLLSTCTFAAPSTVEVESAYEINQQEKFLLN